MNKKADLESLPEARSITGKRNIKRCCRCNGCFGLVRYRYALNAFCSKRCINEYKYGAARRKSRIKSWADYLRKL
jgi:hypothetical protein